MSALRRERQIKMIEEASYMYVNGASIEEICEKFGRKKGCIYRWLRIGGGDEDIDKSKNYSANRRAMVERTRDRVGYVPSVKNKGELPPAAQSILNSALKRNK